MSQIFHNNKKLERRRRTLRQKATKAEILLWSRIRRKQLGYKFRQQHSIGSYIVDFYCPKLRLIVELDGSIHDTETIQIRDRKRQKFLEEKDFIILRYRNYKILNDLEEVIDDLKFFCDKLSTSPDPSSFEEGNLLRS